jgi:methionyl aminopeptidase
MIKLKSAAEIEKMRVAGRIAAQARQYAGSLVRPGVSTYEIDRKTGEFIRNAGAVPTFLNYNGYPGNVCVSVNEEIIHGIGSKKRIIKAGDIVSVDVGATIQGYVGDCADTFVAGTADEAALRLIEVTRASFAAGLAAARPGNRISDISRAVQTAAESAGYGVVREYIGHGVGQQLHEDPEVPNFTEERRRGPDPRLIPGMTIAIEPMINEGTHEIRLLPDGWTVVTKDGSRSAHYENTVLITNNGAVILTAAE